MKHETTPKSNRTLESSLLIIMLCAGLMGIMYHLGTSPKGDSNMVVHYEQGSDPQQAYLSIDPTAEVGLPVQFILHSGDPQAKYLLDLGQGQIIDIGQTAFQHIFRKSGSFPIKLILRGPEGDKVLDTYQIKITDAQNLAAY